MPQITVSIDEDVKKVLDKRAKENFLTLKEQIEDILRRSAVQTKSSKDYEKIDIDDKLVGIFSRSRRGRKPKKKKAKK